MSRPKKYNVTPTQPCPYCNSINHLTLKEEKNDKHGRRWRCNSCKKTFTETPRHIFRSSIPLNTWREAILCTLNSESLDVTMKKCKVKRQTAFMMRHRILICAEQIYQEQNKVLQGTCQIDASEVNECNKGVRHKDKKVKQDDQQNQIRLWCAVDSTGQSMITATADTGNPSEHLATVLDPHLARNAKLIVDDKTHFEKLNREVISATHDSDNDKTLTKAANLTLSWKSRYAAYHGVASKYLNRYNAMINLSMQYILDQEPLIQMILAKLEQPVKKGSSSWENIPSQNLLYGKMTHISE